MDNNPNQYRMSSNLTKSMTKIGLDLNDIIDESKTKSFVSAYKAKSDLLRVSSKENLIRQKIYTSSPVKAPPEGKYNHQRGALITAGSPSKMRSLTVAYGSSPSVHPTAKLNDDSVYSKLNKAENFPLAYKKKYEGTSSISGDFLDDPVKAINLLKGTSSSNLNISGRSADFKSEVQWRMQLRNN